jgi:hypothetical protein
MILTDDDLILFDFWRILFWRIYFILLYFDGRTDFDLTDDGRIYFILIWFYFIWRRFYSDDDGRMDDGFWRRMIGWRMDDLTGFDGWFDGFWRRILFYRFYRIWRTTDFRFWRFLMTGWFDGWWRTEDFDGIWFHGFDDGFYFILSTDDDDFLTDFTDGRFDDGWFIDGWRWRTDFIWRMWFDGRILILSWRIFYFILILFYFILFYFHFILILFLTLDGRRFDLTDDFILTDGWWIWRILF